MVSAKAVPAPAAAALQTPSASALPSEVFRGLTSTPRSLSPWLFYDERGSALFERITELPEYYVTRTERALFAAHAGEMIFHAADEHRLAIIELGAGTASKTGLLLAAAMAHQNALDFYAIDVSETALMLAKQHLEQEIPGVRVHARVGDYTEGIGQLEADADLRKLVLYIGSSIGNFEPHDACEVLAAVRRELSPGDQLLLGADQVKDERVLLAAYDDAEGVTAAFNLNVLARINRELGGDFAPEDWAHEARWNRGEQRIEMHLRSRCRQTVEIAGLGLLLDFAAGETIHTENSYKFTDTSVGALLSGAGFRMRRTWKDAREWFAVYLAEAV